MSIGRVVVGSRVRLPAAFVHASPAGIGLDGGTVVSVTRPSPDSEWAMVDLGEWGEFGFRSEHLARHGADFSMSIQWLPVGSDRVAQWTTSVHETWADARGSGRQMACMAGVSSLRIHGPWGDELASWFRDGVWCQLPHLADVGDDMALDKALRIPPAAY